MTLDATSLRMSEAQDACNVAALLTTTSRKDAMAEPIEDLPGEIWKPIVGWEGRYKVSNKGRVRSVSRLVTYKTGATRVHPARVLKLNHTIGGYAHVWLWDGMRDLGRRVHHLVLEAFVGPRPPNAICCHGNGCRSDNRPENLRWGTSLDNEADKARHGTTARGVGHGQSKLTTAAVQFIRKHYKRRSRQYGAPAFAAKFGVSVSAIERIAKRKTWTHI